MKDLQKAYERPIHGDGKPAQYVAQILGASGKTEKNLHEMSDDEFWRNLMERLPTDVLEKIDVILEEWADEQKTKEGTP